MAENSGSGGPNVTCPSTTRKGVEARGAAVALAARTKKGEAWSPARFHPGSRRLSAARERAVAEQRRMCCLVDDSDKRPRRAKTGIKEMRPARATGQGSTGRTLIALHERRQSGRRD